MHIATLPKIISQAVIYCRDPVDLKVDYSADSVNPISVSKANSSFKTNEDAESTEVSRYYLVCI